MKGQRNKNALYKLFGFKTPAARTRALRRRLIPGYGKRGRKLPGTSEIASLRKFFRSIRALLGR